MSVYAKLNKARLMFHATPLKKSGHNKFAGFRYFELSDILGAALRICDEVGISCTISFNGDEATMRVVDIEDGSQVIFNTPVADALTKGQLPIQALGSMHSYIRRYLWLLAFEVVENDVIDAVIGSDAATPAEVERISFDQQVELEELIERTQTDEALVLQYYKINKLADLPVGQFNSVKKLLGKKLK